VFRTASAGWDLVQTHFPLDAKGDHQLGCRQAQYVDGQEMFKHACGVGLEGVVSKVRDSRYHSGSSNDWVKRACAQRETLPIAGFALKENKFDGIYLGRHKGKELVYAGKVDHGFNAASAKDLQARLKPLIRKTQPYAKKIAHRGVWVEPSLLAEVEYRAKSAEDKVRIRFQGHSGRFVMDIYDGADWTEMDIDDLKAAIENGSSIEEATRPIIGSLKLPAHRW
jgi:ATP-dependent DNA ligase